MKKRRVWIFWLWVRQILNYLKIRIFITFDTRYHGCLGNVMAIHGVLFFVLRNDLRQTLEIDDFEETSILWCTFSPQHSVGSNCKSGHFEFIDLLEYSTWKLIIDFFENQCQLWICLLPTICSWVWLIIIKNHIIEIVNSNRLKIKYSFHSSWEKQNVEEVDVLSVSLRYIY